MKEKLKEELNELVKIFKERDTVRKILQAKDAKAAYKEEKVAMAEQLESFYHEMQVFIDDNERPFSEPSEFICPENVVDIYFIFLMSRVDDFDLTDHFDNIGEILKEAPEDLQEIAGRLYEYLFEDYYAIKTFTEEKLLKKLLL